MVKTNKSSLKVLLTIVSVLCLLLAFAFTMSKNATAAENDSATIVQIPSADTTSYVYNGQQQAYKLAESEYYTIKNNKKVNAGVYEVTVSLNDKNLFVWSDGTTEDLKYSFSIARAPYHEKYDISNVKFDTKYVVADGKAHSIEISGELPAGITVSYSPNSYTEPGMYQVTASFIGGDENYTGIPSKTAQLVINKASISTKLDKNSEKDDAIVSSEEGIDPRINGFTLESVSVEKNEALLALLDEDEKIACAYTAKLKINDVVVQPNGEVVLKLLIPEDAYKHDVKVFRITDDGTVTEMEMEKNDGYAIFETDRIAKFAITYTEGPSYAWLWILLVIVAVLVVVTVVVVMMVKVGKAENDDFDDEDDIKESKR